MSDVPTVPAAPAGASPAQAHPHTGSPNGAPWVTALRAQPRTLAVGTPDAAGAAWTVRVEVPEVWDAVRLTAPSAERVLEVKAAALEALLPGAAPGDYVVKLNGVEVRDEQGSLAAAGARDGSIFVVTSRRRRPVR